MTLASSAWTRFHHCIQALILLVNSGHHHHPIITPSLLTSSSRSTRRCRLSSLSPSLQTLLLELCLFLLSKHSSLDVRWVVPPHCRCYAYLGSDMVSATKPAMIRLSVLLSTRPQHPAVSLEHGICANKRLKCCVERNKINLGSHISTEDRVIYIFTSHYKVLPPWDLFGGPWTSSSTWQRINNRNGSCRTSASPHIAVQKILRAFRVIVVHAQRNSEVCAKAETLTCTV